MKRQIIKVNLGGHETNPSIKGNENKVIFGSGADPALQLTLLRKAGHQVGRILEGGTDVAMAPVKWLSHMQDNWLTYIVCAAILMVGSMIIYYCIRRKLSSLVSSSPADSNMSQFIMNEAIKLGTFRHALEKS